MPSAHSEAKLTAQLDKLVYHHGGKCLSPEHPHAFVYFITLRNRSEETLRILGRKWVLLHEDGSTQVIEGEGIIGENPVLPPGELFSYNSYHVTPGNARVRGCFHGLDEQGKPIQAHLEEFTLVVPT